MKRNTRLFAVVCAAAILTVLTTALVVTAFGAGAKTAKYRSPMFVAVSPDGQRVYASDHTAGCIVVMDGQTNKKLSEWPVNGQPSGLALSGDGKTLYAAIYSRGKVAAISTASGKVVKEALVGVRPMALAYGKRTGRLYVCNRAVDSISVLDAATLKAAKEISVVRDPQFAALTPDESKLVVSNSMPRASMDDEIVSGAVSIIDTKTLTPTNVKICNGATNLRTVAIDPSGAWAYVVHTVSRFNLPTTQLDRGWMNTSGLTIIDLKTNKVETTVLLDSVDRGAADPWGVAVTPDGKRLFVGLGGTHEIEAIEIAKLHQLLRGEFPQDAPLKAGDPSAEIWTRMKDDPKAKEELVDNLAALDSMNLVNRFSCGGNGVRGIAVSPDAKRLFAADYFTGNVAVFDTATDRQMASIPAGQQPVEDIVRKGEKTFADASLCYQTWQSCETCHPNGRSDGLRWDLMNDGIGNPKKTRSMVASFKSSPVMSLGVRADAKMAVRAGFKFILFTEVDPSYHAAVDAYLKQLAPEPSPYRTREGNLTPAALRGKKVFFGKARCGDCHNGPIYSDMKAHPGMIPPAVFDKPGDKFYTPKLVEVYRCAPYLHDGRAATLKDVLTKYNKGDKHGMTSKLSANEMNDLIAFLRSL